MKLSYKNFVVFGILPPFLSITLLINLLYIYDPLQLFHKPLFREITFLNDMRVQNRGIIKNYDFNSVILGTSMLENTLPKDANEILQLDSKNLWVNLSMHGASFNERAVVLDFLLRTKTIKNIIYSLDWFGFTDENEVDSFNFLYKDDSINNIRIYFNTHFITCAIEWSKDSKCVGKQIDIYKQSFGYWANNYAKYFGSVQNYLKNSENIKEFSKKETKINLIESRKLGQRLSKVYILDYVKKYPNTKFYFLIPPVSRLYFVIKGNDFFKAWSDNIRDFVVACKELENVKIYGFDTLSYPDNIANYKDSRHYNADMNLLQLKAIANNTNIIDSKNIESYLKEMEIKIKNYDISPFLNVIKDSKEINILDSRQEAI